MRKFFLILPVVLIIGIILFSASTCGEKIPERIVNRVLTDEEMAVPPGRFQHYGGFDFTHRNNLPPLQGKPVIDWSLELEYPSLMFWMLVDSDGGIWVPVDAKEILYHTIYTRHKLMRISPDGTVDWEREYLPAGGTNEPRDRNAVNPNRIYTERTSYVEPIIALNGSVILHASRDIYRSKSGKSTNPIGYFNEFVLGNQRAVGNNGNYEFLECVDLDGNTLWRTEPVDYEPNYGPAVRISDNRIGMMVDREHLYIYDLAEGELIDTITPEGWFFEAGAFPIETQDGTWFGILTHFTDHSAADFLCDFNSDGEILWSSPASGRGRTYGPYLSDTCLLTIKNYESIAGFDFSDGDPVWNMDLEIKGRCDGVTPDGNFILTEVISDYQALSIKSITPSGEVAWEHVDQNVSIGSNDVTIFEDGSLLVGTIKGILYLSPDGELLWKIETSDLGLDDSEVFRVGAALWKLFPQPDGRLILLVCGFGSNLTPENYIFSLKPPE